VVGWSGDRAPFPSPLAGEGGLRRRSGEGSLKRKPPRPAFRLIAAVLVFDPSSVGFADTFSRKGRRKREAVDNFYDVHPPPSAL
jgi:hypothetical protein